MHHLYIDGGLAPDGLSKLNTGPPEVREARIRSAMEFDGGISVPPFPADYCGIVEPSVVVEILIKESAF